jgi:NADH dehydrogenase
VVAASEEQRKTRIVILGGGFGGLGAARQLERTFWRDPSTEIVLISQSNYLLFTPMLAEVAASALEPQHIGSPVRASLPHIHFRRAEVEMVDTTRQVVRVRSGGSGPPEELPYDHLVLALGSVPHYYGLPGMEAHCFTLKTLEDATKLRNHVIAQLERADLSNDGQERRNLLTFAVAGGGFAGTELIAELCDLVHSVVRYYPTIRAGEPRFILVHSRDRILPELGPELADYAMRKLKARGIEFMLNTRVTGATVEGVLVGEGQLVAARTVVWTAGNQPNPILKTLPCEHSKGGAVVVEPTLRVKGFANLWAVGDCAQIPDPEREGQFYPPTAQHAIREGRAAASNIAAALRGRPLKPFRFRAIGMLVPLGQRTGAAEVRGLRFSGLLAWLMWRTVYLSLLPGLERKVRVSFDWLFDLLFPRDIVLTSTPSTPNPGPASHADGSRGAGPGAGKEVAP